jgi:hypothetical protein
MTSTEKLSALYPNQCHLTFFVLAVLLECTDPDQFTKIRNVLEFKLLILSPPCHHIDQKAALDAFNVSGCLVNSCLGVSFFLFGSK